LKLIIRDKADDVAEWAAKYVIKRINVSVLNLLHIILYGREILGPQFFSSTI
jgi:hypothetical protein